MLAVGQHAFSDTPTAVAMHAQPDAQGNVFVAVATSDMASRHECGLFHVNTAHADFRCRFSSIDLDGPATAIAASPFGTTVALASPARVLLLRNEETASIALSSESTVTAACHVAGTEHVAVVSDAGEFALVDLRTASLVSDATEVPGVAGMPLRCLVCTPAGALFAACEHTVVHLTHSGDVARAFKWAPGDHVTSVAANSHYVVAGTEDGAVVVWDVVSGDMLVSAVVEHRCPIVGGAFANDSTFIAASNSGELTSCSMTRVRDGRVDMMPAQPGGRSAHTLSRGGVCGFSLCAPCGMAVVVDDSGLVEFFAPRNTQ